MSNLINQLPNEILYMIFQTLPIVDLIRIERVCKKWQEVQKTTLARMNTLSGCELYFVWEYPDFYRLKFFKPLKFTPTTEVLAQQCSTKPLSPDHVMTPSMSYFFRKVPNITCLSLFGIQIDFETIKTLTTSWRHLYEFNLFPAETGTFRYESFCPILKNLTALRRLGMTTFAGQETRFDFSAFASLESIFFDNHFQEMYSLYDVIRCLGPNIRTIGVVNVSHERHELHQLVRFLRFDIQHGRPLAKRLKSRVTHFTFQMDLFDDENFNGADAHLIKFAVEFFPNLTHLDIHLFEDVLFEEILEPLSKLQKLTHLRLDAINTCFRSRLFELPDNEQPRIMLPRLAMVTNLHLSLDHSSTPTLSFYKLYWKQVFPRLTLWHFENAGLMYRCECQPDLTRDCIFNGIQCRDCPSKLLTFFQNELSTLQQVYRNNHLVFRRDDIDLAEFTQRLVHYGTSPYLRNSKVWFPNFG